MFDLNELKAQIDAMRDESAVKRAVWAKDVVTDVRRLREETCGLLGQVLEVAFGFETEQAWDHAHKMLVTEIPRPVFPYVPRHRKEGAAA